MAKVMTWQQGTWTGGKVLFPSDSHSWVGWGGDLGNTDVVSVMAWPHTVHDPQGVELDVRLEVQDVFTGNSSNGWRVHWTVRNVGSNYVRSYNQILMILRP